MSLTITIPGAVNVTTGAMAPAVLTVGVGVPGAQGPAGPAGPGVPVGGTAGQYLQKIDGTNYNTDWVTLNLAAYAVKANNLSDLTNFATARDNLSLGTLNSPTFAGLTAQGAGANVANLTPTSLTLDQTGYGYFTIQPSQGIRFPDASVQTTAFPAGADIPTGGTTGQALVKVSNSNYDVDWATVASYISSVSSPLSVTTGNLTIDLSAYLTSATAASTYQTLAGMSSYLTTATAASTYAVIAAGQPTSGTVGQVLTKNSGTNYDSSWQTLIPGDRYLTTSTTSNTVSNGAKTFTVGTGLSYSSQQDVVISYNASNHMHALVTSYNSGTGVLVVDVNHHTGSGTYTAWTVNVGGMVPLQSVEWGEILGTLGDQTDLATALNAKLETSTAASTYAPIASPTFTGTVTIPAGASISGFAPLASPALTGNVTITSSTGAALFITQTGTGNILTLHDQASDTNFVAIDANGKVSTIPSEATNGAGFNIAHGAAPTTPVNGDIWTTTSGLFARINGGTQQYAPLGSNNIFSNSSSTYGSSTATGTINVASGAAISGSTKTVNVGTSGVSGSTTNITVGPVLGTSTISVGNTTAASTLNLATGATLTATTKAVNIGTNGVSGSTTNITIGSTTGTSTTTLQGITNGVTQSAGDSSLKLATTAFVTTADNLKANLASPTFTGTPTLPTGTIATTQTAGNNTTAVATTAFVTAAVPAIASVAQANSPSSNALAMTPDKVRQMIMFPGFQQFLGGGSTGTSGTGAFAPSTANRWRQFQGPNVSTAGYSAFVFDTQNSSIGFIGSKRGSNEYGKNYARALWMAGRTLIGTDDGGFGGDVNNLFRCELGGRNSIATNGDPDRASLGWRVAGGGSQAIVFYMRSRTTVNGGTYSETTTSFSPVYNQWFDWLVTYNGTDTCQMYVNDTLVGTISANFTGFQGEAFNFYSERIEQTASAATRMEVNHLPPRIFFSE